MSAYLPMTRNQFENRFTVSMELVNAVINAVVTEDLKTGLKTIWGPATQFLNPKLALFKNKKQMDGERIETYH
jgi:hypothetical protein